MEHTIEAYISRLTTEKLQWFLKQHAAGELKEDYTYIIPSLHAELSRRNTPTRDN